MAQEQTLNVPQLIAIILLALLAARWYFSSNPAASGAHGSGGGRGARRINPAQVDQVLQMFPQLGRREIMWDLQRNGGNVQATIERVLAGRTLERPPPSFQPIEASQPASTSASNASQSRTQLQSDPDLLTRYNLKAKAENVDQAAAAGSSAGTGWSTNKVERSAALRQRREEMILAARRKMQTKDKDTPQPGPSQSL